MGSYHSVLGFRYSVEAEVELTDAELGVLTALASVHHDPRSKQAVEPSGFLHRLNAISAYDQSRSVHDVVYFVSSEDVETLLKILESKNVLNKKSPHYEEWVKLVEGLEVRFTDVEVALAQEYIRINCAP